MISCSSRSPESDCGCATSWGCGRSVRCRSGDPAGLSPGESRRGAAIRRGAGQAAVVQDAQAAGSLFDRAVAADPKHALTHSGLAATWSQLGYDERAKNSARRAFELSANLTREDRLLVEGRYHQAMNQHLDAVKTYQTLYGFFPVQPRGRARNSPRRRPRAEGRATPSRPSSRCAKLLRAHRRRSAHRPGGGGGGRGALRLQATAGGSQPRGRQRSGAGSAPAGGERPDSGVGRVAVPR